MFCASGGSRSAEESLIRLYGSRSLEDIYDLSMMMIRFEDILSQEPEGKKICKDSKMMIDFY